ncbi:hypothetical protein AB2E84_14245 [Escherichia coli]
MFAAKNPKIVDVGIGKYGLTNSIVKGARLTFYVAVAYRTIDFILNDETSLAEFIGALATDVGKIAIASAVSWGAGKALLYYWVCCWTFGWGSGCGDRRGPSIKLS